MKLTPLSSTPLTRPAGEKSPEKATIPRPVLAIDPGAEGGLALRCSNGTLECWKMPPQENEVGDLLREIQSKFGEPVVYIEKVGGYHQDKEASRQTGSHMFNFGLGYGYTIGFCEALGWSVERIAPQTWQSALGYYGRGGKGDDKKRFLKERALERYPDIGKKITLKTCDALLLLAYAEPRVRMQERAL